MWPSIVEKDERGTERVYDLVSRLLKDRIILVSEEINSGSASSIIAQLLYLEADDSKAPITVYINSPGGSIADGLAIYDIINNIKCPVSTVCVGMAASMGAFLLSGGTKGKRFALPNAEIMIHQPLGGMSGMNQASDMEIEAEHIKRIKHRLLEIMASNCGKDYATLEKDCDRNNWMTAEEAKAYGLVDHVVTNRNN